MPERINFIPNGAITTGKVIPQTGNATNTGRVGQAQPSFQEIFQNEVSKKDDLKFSAHVLKRLQERNISLSGKEVDSIRQAVDKAEEKGIQESLVVMRDISFIVSVKNKTVITAIGGQNMKENVITNIDGAVFI